MDRPATGPVSVRLDGRTAMNLPPREASWLLVTDPHLPRPGEVAQVHLQHVGAPATFPAGEATLRHDGQAVTWTTIDTDTRTLVAEVTPGADALSLPLTLAIDEAEVGSKTMPTARSH